MRLNVEIKNSVYEEFTKHADRQGRSISDIIRVLILEWNRRQRVEFAREREMKEIRDDR